MGVSKNPGPQVDPKIVGLLLQGLPRKVQKRSQNGAKMDPKWTQNGPLTFRNSYIQTRLRSPRLKDGCLMPELAATPSVFPGLHMSHCLCRLGTMARARNTIST